MPNCCVFPTGAYFPLTQCSYFQAEKSLVEFAEPTKSDCFYGSEIHRTSISEIRSREYFFLLTKGVCVCFPIRCYHFNKLRYAFFFSGNILRNIEAMSFGGILLGMWRKGSENPNVEENRTPGTSKSFMSRTSKSFTGGMLNCIGYEAPINLSCPPPIILALLAYRFVSDARHL